MSFLSLESKITIHLAWKAQIALLLAKKITILAKNANFANIFSKKLAKVLSEYTGINKNIIKLENSKPPPYGLIHSLDPVKLYIKTNLANSFIRPLKSPTGVLILFIRKFYNSFCLCVNYQGLNNLTIKNQYLLSLIDESLDRLW